MLRKIGTFLIIMLAISAVLLLMATGSRKPYQTPATAETTAPTTGTTESTEPSAVAQPQSADAEEGTTEPTVYSETEPQTTAPTEGDFWSEEYWTEEYLPEEEEQETAVSGENLRRVRQILEREKLGRTARSHWVWNRGLNSLEGTTGTARSSNGWALALLAAERKMNPIAAFWVLQQEGLYSKTTDDSGVLAASSFSVPSREVSEYAYTDEGARRLVTDLLALAAGLEDNLAMESGMLGANYAVDEGQMSLSRSDGCYYGYFISGGERSTHILCFYLRSGRDGKTITDVEFQLLNLRSARGSEEDLAVLDRRGDTQAAVLIAAAELLMTGQTQAGQGLIPCSRQVTSFDADIERIHFAAEDEVGTLTNYRLRKA